MDLNPLGIYVPFAEVFPCVSSDFASFQSGVRQLSLTDALFWCARLNLMLSNPANLDHRRKQESAIRVFFAADEIARINAFARTHQREDYDLGHIAVFFRGQLLELMRWVCLWCEDHPDDGVTFERPTVRSTFAQVALMASDLWARHIYGDRFSLDGGRDLAQNRALGAIRGAIADTSFGMDPLLALGRGYAIICKHLPHFYADLSQEFSARTGLSLDEFYHCLAALMTSFLNRTPENVQENPGLFNVKIVCASAPHVQPLIATYLALESQVADELRDALWGPEHVTRWEDASRYNYKPLRRRPILRASDGRAIIMEAVFYAERASVGPLFLITAGVPRATSDQIFSAFGYAFEEYAGSLLRRMYPVPGPGLVDRLCCDVHGRDRAGQPVQITDACLNDVTEAILFEMKAVWVRDDVVLDDNYERYLDHLRDKYGVRTNGKGGRSIKGVGQLARTITNLTSGEWTPLTEDFTRVEQLYPVLLVHDPLLDAPVHGKFLATEFAAALVPEEVGRTGMMRKGRFWVAPLIVMTIDDLEALETSIEHSSLLDLLRDYSVACSDRVASLHNYLAASEYRRKLYYSRATASNTLEVLKQTGRLFFPHVIDPQDSSEKRQRGCSTNGKAPRSRRAGAGGCHGS
jgi:hypothetical protein